MTTFQAIVYAIVNGLTELLPISAKTHQVLVPYLMDWHPPTGPLLGALTLGSLCALLVYFRHDWASMISCTLQVILFRKKPMTLDERLPLFIGVSTLPALIASSYFGQTLLETEWSPPFLAAVFGAIGLPLWFFDSFSRKSKGLYDWNGLDATIVGLTQVLAIAPGGDPLTGVLMGAFFLNYKRETAAKYAYFTSVPILVMETLGHLKGVTLSLPAPMPEVSWLTFFVALIVTFFVSLLVIGAFMKHVLQRGMSQYVIYRCLFAGGICVVYWMRNHSF